MSRVIDAGKSKHTTPLTQAPGTVEYIPPEALQLNPKYAAELDCFSFGVLAIQIMTRLFSDPSFRTREIPIPTDMAIIFVPETESRKNHIDMIDKSHPLLQIALKCLAHKPEDRPSAQDLCLQLECHLKCNIPAKDLNTQHLCECAELRLEKVSLENKIAHLEEELNKMLQFHLCHFSDWKKGKPAPIAFAGQSSAVHPISVLLCSYRTYTSLLS